MPTSNPSVALIVASYLREQYPTALGPFLLEAGLDESALDGDQLPDLRTIIHDHYASLLVSSLSRATLNPPSSHLQSTNVHSTYSPQELMQRKLATAVPLGTILHRIGNVGVGNLLSVRVEWIGCRWFDTGTASYKANHRPYILTTSTDQTLKIISLPTSPSSLPIPPQDGIHSEAEVETILKPHKAAVLTFAIYPERGGRGRGRYVLTGSMDGSAILTDLITNTQIQTFRHTKFVVRVAFSPDGRWLVTASYDRTIAIYEVDPARPVARSTDDDDLMDEDLDPEDDPLLASDPDLHFSLRHTLTDLPGNPESLVFHPTSSHLLYTTRSSHILHYLSLPSFRHTTKSFNPNPADTHVSFSVLNMAVHPDGGLLACQTGDHAGHAGERVLIYDIAPPVEDEGSTSGTESGSARGDERLQTIWTGSEGDDYVMPRMSWLPDGSGIVTTTTTGQLTLLDLSGKIRSRLKLHGGLINGAPTSEIVRDVHAVMVPVESGPSAADARSSGDSRQELRIVSVGYDGQIYVSK